MKLIEANFEIKTPISWINDYAKIIEECGRECYQSSHNITENSSNLFVDMIMKKGHTSVIEHCIISVHFTTNRGISHEIVRHRIGSYSQESTRYCNYNKEKFNKEITCINMTNSFKIHKDTRKWDEIKTIYALDIIEESFELSEQYYLKLIEKGVPPELARNVLPTGLKTGIVVTYNLRQWIEFFKQRTSETAHPEMRELTIPLLEQFKVLLPTIFGDL